MRSKAAAKDEAEVDAAESIELINLKILNDQKRLQAPYAHYRIYTYLQQPPIQLKCGLIHFTCLKEGSILSMQQSAGLDLTSTLQ